ncbi:MULTISPECIES: fumarylacetoacetate hydrolase family protein [Streptomyces]|uniref:2-hydroxyhepta-2,4-diene-1,7-dioate isomerase n=3 Tax=Streptomyces griseoaurantiacus TaxID=68213 RepID=F3ND85_9ACTN|nr:MULTISPECIES: fumarylacetoacetate hydrolase family protein [Streptomyces]EGG48522.1 2-hydroxyhepta-2,4-diene-1,7-dioate isomerase [Streptomyces griseoaurantiacus M045]MBA5224920.1 fumarylacetoacetate hydrolase family protein [Streptomyces griseoaurantiacus]MDX3088651.1 fumarylacetoacetate hydrolase family protein [Streptomyces sp. ME12-02E]MDX3331833.1 fumarylacetoacetate hydrolase family protein [Streptomyces sp. ME02-6978a]MDX3358547.1 fumarylacetoacetate hydrolase family protein [Strepto
MKFARIGEAGREIPVALAEDHYVDLSALTDDIDGAFLSQPLEDVAATVRSGGLPRIPREGQRVGAPIARPSAVVCVGMNYAAHAAESGAKPPEDLVVFLKTPNTVTGPEEELRIPPGSERTDWEVELGVVIGRRASYLGSPEEALGHVAGYTLVNDVSEREWQLERSGGQWGKGKSFPGFSPVGPWLVTADEVDPGDLRLRSWVNGAPRQDSRTSDMIFDVAQIVWRLSQFLVLEPGDLVMTGTPEGVALSGRFPYLRPGDVVEVAIDGLGRQRQAVR